jgi:hypothetical protein
MFRVVHNIESEHFLILDYHFSLIIEVDMWEKRALF